MCRAHSCLLPQANSGCHVELSEEGLIFQDVSGKRRNMITSSLLAMPLSLIKVCFGQYVGFEPQCVLMFDHFYPMIW